MEDRPRELSMIMTNGGLVVYIGGLIHAVRGGELRETAIPRIDRDEKEVGREVMEVGAFRGIGACPLVAVLDD